VTSWAEQHRDADANWRWVRQQAEQVVCPRCHAEPGVTCRNPGTGLVFKKAPAHWQRFKAAEGESA